MTACAEARCIAPSRGGTYWLYLLASRWRNALRVAIVRRLVDQRGGTPGRLGAPGRDLATVGSVASICLWRARLWSGLRAGQRQELRQLRQAGAMRLAKVNRIAE